MKRSISVLLVLMFLFPASALADLRRGDRGEEVRELQQMLWDTGFIFEEPDGVFGGNTEKAVKWFQEYALLEQTGVADDRTIDSLYACWLRIMEENGYTVPDDEMEPQTAGFVPGYNPYGDDYGEDYGDSYGDYPAYCHRYTTDSGRRARRDVRLPRPAGRKSVAAGAGKVDERAQRSLQGVDRPLYGEGSRRRGLLSGVLHALAGAAGGSRLEQQGVENVDDHIEALLRNQCVELCERVYAARTE